MSSAALFVGLAALAKVYLDPVIVVPEHRLIFCVIPKSGSQAWLNLLRRASGLGFNNGTNGFSPHYPSDRRWPRTLSSYPHRLARSMLKNSSWLKLVSLRDPLVRLRSAWLEKIHSARDVPAMLAKYADNCGVAVSELRNVTFEHFVTAIVAKLPSVNDHFGRQADQCRLSEFANEYAKMDITNDPDCEGALRYTLQRLESFTTNTAGLRALRDTFENAPAGSHATHAAQDLYQPAVVPIVRKAFAADYALLSESEDTARWREV